MTHTLARLRAIALTRQGGRCFYCDLPMWSSEPGPFAARHGLTLRQARWLQATAEHLHPRQDGGPHLASNIAAACLTCNARRHRRRTVPSPQQYRRFVQARVEQGRWHPSHVLRSGRIDASHAAR